MRKWLPLIAVCLGTFMLLVDVTIVNVALPDMAIGLGTSFSALEWVIDAYALALAALVLGTGSMADLFGHRRSYVSGLALFAVASLVCGLAPNAALLITARTVQGVGAAAMFATTFALLNASYSGRDRGTAYGMWGAVAGASAAVGPIIGGVLTEAISWRWIFFVNLPVSVLAIVMCQRVFVRDGQRSATRVDLSGMVMFTASAAALTFGLIRTNELGWTSVQTLGLLVVGVVLLAVFVLIEARSAHPMLDLALFRAKPFVGTTIAALFLSFSAFAALTYTSIWLQSVIGLSPIAAGLTGLPLSAAVFATSAGIGRFLHGSRPGPIIAGGMTLIGLGGLVCVFVVHGSASWPALVPGYLLVGVGVGLATPTLSSSAMSAVPVQRGGMAAGVINTARQLGYAFGIALLGSIFAARAQSSISAHHVPNAGAVARGLSGGQSQGLVARAAPAQRGPLLHVLHVASISGLQATFLVAGIAGVLVGVLVFVLVRSPRPETASAGGSPTGIGEPAAA